MGFWALLCQLQGGAGVALLLPDKHLTRLGAVGSGQWAGPPSKALHFLTLS